MPKKTIADEEIALIKAMLARKMKNKDIQFFFNRPDRPVNSGRITGIASGSYGNCAKIPRASDATLDAFIASHQAPDVAAILVPGQTEMVEVSEARHPAHPEAIAALFARDDAGIWRFKAGETDEHECKANFGFKHSGAWLRAIAALANNRGGYVLFGVQDKNESDAAKSYAVTGLKSNEFGNADPAEFTKRIKSVLDPTPRVHIISMEIGGQPIGVMYVEQHPSRPVIATKPEGDQLKEGDIFYRYPGQSNRIKYSDLRALLDERDAQARRDVMPLVERLLALGPKRALIADLDAGILDDGKRPIVIDPGLIDQINFIREGEFDDVAGAPTLKLVGTVTTSGGSGRGAITDENVLANFLDQETLVAPTEYIRFAVAGSNRNWLPIFYFAGRAGLSRDELVALVEGTVTSKTKHRAELAQRAGGERSAKAKHSGTPAKMLKALLAGEPVEIEGPKSASNVALAVQGLPDEDGLDAQPLLELLKKCRDVLVEAEQFEVLSNVYRAAARLDELIAAR
jgi:Putative DNA-binding domain